jgi:hypothetical protein
VATFIYKAYDSAGRKKSGTLHGFSAQDANLTLRERGLKVYFIADLHKLKEAVRHKRQVRKTIIYGGAALVVIALVGSGAAVSLAGRVKPLGASDYRKAGLITSGSGNIVADSEEGKQLASDIYDAWNSFAPRVLTGIEIRNGVMTLHVTRAASRLVPDDFEYLAVNSVRALHRQTDAPGATLVVLQDDMTILEVRYNGLTNSTHITRFD